MDESLYKDLKSAYYLSMTICDPVQYQVRQNNLLKSLSNYIVERDKPTEETVEDKMMLANEKVSEEFKSLSSVLSKIAGLLIRNEIIDAAFILGQIRVRCDRNACDFSKLEDRK